MKPTTKSTRTEREKFAVAPSERAILAKAASLAGRTRADFIRHSALAEAVRLIADSK